MLIGIEKKFVFVANTKTASTSIEKVLAPHAEVSHGGTPARKHVPLRRIYSLYPEVFRGGAQKPVTHRFFKFGVMRDPIDWLGSWFRYRKGNKVDSPLPAEMTFQEFWEKRDWNIIKPDGARFLQRHLFCAAEGHVLADVIIPYEQLNGMFGEICDCLGIDSPLPRENVSHLSDFEVPPALEAALREHLAPDYALRNRLDEINEKGMARLRARMEQG